jgi:hypothetical protein
VCYQLPLVADPAVPDSELDDAALEDTTVKRAYVANIKRTYQTFAKYQDIIGIPEGGWFVDVDKDHPTCECRYFLKKGYCVHLVHVANLLNKECVGLPKKKLKLSSNRVKKVGTTAANRAANMAARRNVAQRGGGGRGRRGRGGGRRGRGGGRPRRNGPALQHN